MKANSAAPVLETLAPIVAGFEVASGGEIAKVRAVAPECAAVNASIACGDGSGR